MKIIRGILGRIFAVWAAILFSITSVLTVIPILILGVLKEPQKSILSFPFYRIWMDVFFTLTGIRRKTVGRKNFKDGQVYIIVCNHRSMFDIAITNPYIPGPNKTIAKIEITKVPVFGTLYRRGSVLVDRKSDESRRASFFKMKEVLAMGLHMCIYPEGTRNKTKEPLQKFHDGAFRLAVETGHNIMPIVLFNTAKVLPRDSFFYWPSKVEMHFLPEVSSKNKTSKELKEEVFQIMKDYYVTHSAKI